MGTFIMLTKLSTGAARTGTHIEELERATMDRVQHQCPAVHWLNSYAVLGRPDYIDIFTAPDLETAMKVSALVRTFAAADTEIWPAVEWDQFKSIARSIEL